MRNIWRFTLLFAGAALLGTGVVAARKWHAVRQPVQADGSFPDSFMMDSLREVLEGKAPDCQRITALSVQALRAYEFSTDRWDNLLFALAEAAENAGCELDAREWYALVAAQTRDPVLRAAASMHLGHIERAGGGYQAAETHYRRSMAACDEAAPSLLIDQVRISAINGLSNTLAAAGKHGEALATHRDALDIAARRLAPDDPTSRVLLLNQARLAERTGDDRQALDILAEILRQGPRDDPRDYVEIGIRTHRLAGRVEGVRGSLRILESMWDEHFNVLRQSPAITRLGMELVRVRLKAPGQAPRACDLAAQLIALVGEHESAWLASAVSAERSQLAGALREVRLSCVSTLQSYSLHNNDSYIDLAFMTWLDTEPEDTQHDLILAQWAREKQRRTPR